MNLRRTLPTLFALGVVLLSASAARAGCPCGHCCEPAYVTVQRTIMVPTYETQKRTIQVTVCRPVERQREVTVHCPVPEVKQVEQTCMVMDYERQTRSVPYTVCHTTWTEEQREYTECVPELQQRQGVHMVCRPEAVQVMKTICEDHGGWVTLPCGCGCCRPHTVWKPNIVTREVPITVMKPNYVEEPYVYSVTVMRPVQRTHVVRVPHHTFETKTREVTCLVPAPRQVKRTVNVVTYRMEPQQRIEHYVEMVPETVDRDIYVPICTLVPKQITCVVPAPCPVCGGHW
jgi:hypothetical protein